SVGLPPGIDLCHRTGGPSLLDARQASTFGAQRLRSLELFLVSSCVLRSKIVCDGACFKRAEYITQRAAQRARTVDPTGTAPVAFRQHDPEPARWLFSLALR